MSKLFLVLIAILPVFLICLFVYLKDDEKEPLSLLARLFISGILSVSLVYLFTYSLQLLIPSFIVMPRSGYLRLFLYTFFSVALIEEFSKYIMAYVFGYKDRNFNQPYDIVIYTVFVSLGFACFENIIYVLQNGFVNAILRAVTAVPIHACYGVFMGYYLALARLSKKHRAKRIFIKNMILSILVPVCLHTLYDYLIFLNDPFFILIVMIVIVIMYYFSIKKLVQLSKVELNHI